MQAPVRPVLDIRTVFVSIDREEYSRIVFANTLVLNEKKKTVQKLLGGFVMKTDFEAGL